MLTYAEWASSRNLVGVDVAGNIGILGTLSSASSRSVKKDITPYRGDPLALIRAVRFVRFRYKAEAESERTHVGFIAENTPVDLSGPHHNAFNINNSLAVNMAATQALDREIRQLQAEVRTLTAEVGHYRLHTAGSHSPHTTH
jgi:hypothetical protein